ncbi:hypothetical protein AVEN_218639-1, partial [Araneus ventricosus]
MEFWDDKRNVRTHSYYPMKHNQTVLKANKIQGTRTDLKGSILEANRCMIPRHGGERLSAVDA